VLSLVEFQKTKPKNSTYESITDTEKKSIQKIKTSIPKESMLDGWVLAGSTFPFENTGKISLVGGALYVGGSFGAGEIPLPLLAEECLELRGCLNPNSLLLCKHQDCNFIIRDMIILQQHIQTEKKKKNGRGKQQFASSSLPSEPAEIR
jgi:hypothetical protein